MPAEAALQWGAHGNHIIDTSSDNNIPTTEYNDLINYDNVNKYYNHNQLNNKNSNYRLKNDKETKHNTILKNLEVQSTIDKLNAYWETGRDRLMKNTK